MSDRRVTSPILCVKCGQRNAYERHCMATFSSNPARGWELFCPDCTHVFTWDDLPKTCQGTGCSVPLRDADERGRGLCPKCHLATYSPEKRAALNRLIGMAFKGTATDAEKDAAIDEAFKHLD